MNKLKVIELFAGAGAYSKAFKRLGIDHEILAAIEKDTKTIQCYNLIHNTSYEPADITTLDEKSLPDCDVICYSPPCQSFSISGKQLGFYDKRGILFFDALRIIKEKMPKYCIMENVKGLTQKKFENEFKEMLELLDQIGYNTYWKVLTSKDFNIPHSRQRVYILSIRKDIDKGFEFPEPIPLIKKASDFYENSVGDEYYLRERDMKYLSEFRLKKKYSSLNSDIIVCQTTKQGNLANPQNFVKDNKGYRVMTPGELLSLQGFKNEYGKLLLDNGITKEQVGYMSGNSITVSVLEAIFNKLIEFYPEETQYIRSLSLFSGVGAYEEALKNIEINCQGIELLLASK